MINRPLDSESCQIPRSTTMLRTLLIGIGNRDQFRLAPCPAKDRNPDRQSRYESHWNVDVRITGNSGRCRARAGEMISVDQIDGPGRRTGWSDESVEMMLRHHGVDAFGARHPEIPRECLAVFL